MKCNQECDKQSSCTCGCLNKIAIENCNECINENSIDFSGICKPKEFAMNAKYWTETIVSGTVSVPPEKPSIEEVDKIGVSIQILKRKTINTPNAGPGSVINNEGKTSTGKKLII